jgi:hypothetical protein
MANQPKNEASTITDRSTGTKSLLDLDLQVPSVELLLGHGNVERGEARVGVVGELRLRRVQRAPRRPPRAVGAEPAAAADPEPHDGGGGGVRGAGLALLHRPAGVEHAEQPDGRERHARRDLLDGGNVEQLELQDLERHRQRGALGQPDELPRSVGVHDGLAVPARAGEVGDRVHVLGADAPGERPRRGVVDAGLLGDAAPAGALAVEHAHHARALVHVPDLEQAARTETTTSRVRSGAPLLILILILERESEWICDDLFTWCRRAPGRRRGSRGWGGRGAARGARSRRGARAS